MGEKNKLQPMQYFRILHGGYFKYLKSYIFILNSLD